MKLSLGKLKGSSKGLAYGSRIRPERDWLILLFIALLLFFVSLGFNFWYFSYLTSAPPLGVENGAPEQAAPSVNAVQQIFQNRAAEQARYQGQYLFVDPAAASS